MRLTDSLLVDTAMILALILIGVVGYKLSPLLLPRADVFLAPEPTCDLHRAPCSLRLPEGGRISLSLAPRPIPVAQPLTVEVVLSDLVADAVAVDFSGVEMSMGYNRQALRPAGQGRFVGQATLPVCVTGRMLWQATVLVEKGSTRIAAPFRFEAGH